MSDTKTNGKSNKRIATFFTTAALLATIAPTPAMALAAAPPDPAPIEQVQGVEDAIALDGQAANEGAAQDQDAIQKNSAEGTLATVEQTNDSAAEDNAITFTTHSWDGSQVVTDSKTVNDAKPIPEDGVLAGGTYYVDRDMTYSQRLEVTGDTELVLAEGVTLTVKDGDGGIYVEQGKTLDIFAEGDGSGKIVAQPKRGAAIGAYSGHKGGDVVVHGGTVEAYGAKHCAGIGSNDGDQKEVGSFTMFDGTVIARGGNCGAGIGGGQASEGGHIAIFGGTVDAEGGKYGAGIGGGNGKDKPVKGAHAGNIEIWDGTVTAKGGTNGAGIGGGEGGNAGSIAIHGGNVTATGGNDGAGIGGGQSEGTGKGGTIEITGGAIYAKGNEDAAGIGGGEGGTPGKIIISGGDVLAVSPGDGASIGGGEDGDSGYIEISGGNVVTKGATNGAGIGGGNHAGDGDTILITGGTVNARSKHAAGIGGGRAGDHTFEMFSNNNSGSGAKLTITGGNVTAHSDFAFGIGAGSCAHGRGKFHMYDIEPDANYTGSCGTVVIDGDAEVTADGYLAGIGGDAGKITINGGKVTTTGIKKTKGVAEEDAFGRGIWLIDGKGSLTVNGGQLRAAGFTTELIEANGIKVKHITINGGKVEAQGRKGRNSANGIAGYKDITVSGEGTELIVTGNSGLKQGGKNCTITDGANVRHV